MPACPVGSESGSMCISMFDVRCLMFYLQPSEFFHCTSTRRCIFSPLCSAKGTGQGVRAQGLVAVKFTLTSPSPKPTPLPSLVRPLPDPSLPNGRDKGELPHTPAVHLALETCHRE